MENYKMLIIFEDIEEEAICHAIRDIQCDILRVNDSIIFSAEELKPCIWELNFNTTKESVKTMLDNMLSNLNIQNYYIKNRR